MNAEISMALLKIIKKFDQYLDLQIKKLQAELGEEKDGEDN